MADQQQPVEHEMTEELMEQIAPQWEEPSLAPDFSNDDESLWDEVTCAGSKQSSPQDTETLRSETNDNSDNPAGNPDEPLHFDEDAVLEGSSTEDDVELPSLSNDGNNEISIEPAASYLELDNSSESLGAENEIPEEHTPATAPGQQPVQPLAPTSPYASANLHRDEMIAAGAELLRECLELLEEIRELIRELIRAPQAQQRRVQARRSGSVARPLDNVDNTSRPLSPFPSEEDIRRVAASATPLGYRIRLWRRLNGRRVLELARELQMASEARVGSS